MRSLLTGPAIALLLALPAAASGYGTSYGYSDGYGDAPGYPLSLPQTLRGTVAVPLRASPTAPADTLAELFPVLAACWTAPEALRDAEVEITARLSLRRDGSLIGPPRITYAAGVAGRDRTVLARATLASLRLCTPARITRGLGAAIAGRPLALRFVHRPRHGAG